MEHLARGVDPEAAHRAVRLVELQQAVAVGVRRLEGAAHLVRVRVRVRP